MRRSVILLLFIILVLPRTTLARTWYVKSDGTGDAPTIRAGVDSASTGDSVLVACGTYYEGILMKDGITLLSESGEPDCVTLDGQFQHSLFSCANCESPTVIKGFTITHGMPPMPVPPGRAGGMWIGGDVGGGLEVVNCDFIDNMTYGFGAGVFIEYRSPTFINCTFADNGLSSYGGGMCLIFSSPVLEHCTFVGNSAGYGGGLCCLSMSSPILINCTFYANYASEQASGIYCEDWSNPRLENTIIAYGTWGRAINCDELSAPILEGCDIYGNHIGDWIGCIADQYGVNGNFSADPLFCDAPNGAFTLEACSPCLPGNHPDGYDCGDIIGAFGQGCECQTATEPTTWGMIKSMYR